MKRYNTVRTDTIVKAGESNAAVMTIEAANGHAWTKELEELFFPSIEATALPTETETTDPRTVEDLLQDMDMDVDMEDEDFVVDDDDDYNAELDLDELAELEDAA